MAVKRKTSTGISETRNKKARPLSASSGSVGGKWSDWPAPAEQIEVAREFIKECVRDQHLVLLVPDKDVDGLSSGKIMYNTLISLGHPPDRINAHMLGKCNSVFQVDERKKMEAYGATRVIVMDQGSRGGPPLVAPSSNSGLPVRTLIIDHHESVEFPEGAFVVSACRSPPISTSSLLTYLICLPLLCQCDDDKLIEECAVFALLGVYGDLGPSAVTWDDAPWPAHLGNVAKKVTKKALMGAVSMMNAPRRTSEYLVDDAWNAILHSHFPQDISNNATFLSARAKVNAEVERCTHTAPMFSKDGRVALFMINSGYQVHPVIATRWAGHLKARNLQMVMVANNGYHPSGVHTNFSCRMPVALRKLPDDDRPNLIELLKEYGGLVPPDLKDVETFLERVGSDFAKGHKEATGGIILRKEFESFMKAMEIGVKPDHSTTITSLNSRNKAFQKTKITSFFKPSSSSRDEQDKKS